MFIFKKKEIVLDCFTYCDVAYDYASIKHAKDHLPNWWIKQEPKTVNDSPTIKLCNGLIDYLDNGIVIPSWFDLELKVFRDSRYEWVASNSYVETQLSHPPEQFSLFSLEDGANLKINSVWNFKTNDLVKFSWNQPTWYWREMEDLTLLPGVIDFKRQFSTHINFFIKSPKTEPEKIYRIPSMTPLAIMHPISDKKIVIKNHLISKREWDRFTSFDLLFFTRNFKETMNFNVKRRKYHNDSKCPFHFGKDK